MEKTRNLPLKVAGVAIIVKAGVHNNNTALSVDNLRKIHSGM